MNIKQKHIIQDLIKSCIKIEPSIFLLHLKTNEVITNMPNKLLFYTFFKYMINSLNYNSNKDLYYKWKRIQWISEQKISLQIFDTYHKHSRLNFIIQIINDKIFIQTLTF